MKKQESNKDQLALFSSNSTKHPSNQSASHPPEGKQVFFNHRQAIYSKILNRKMQ